MKKPLLYSALILSTIFIGCNKKEGEPTKSPVTKPIANSVKLNNPINDFVWKAMNSWYKWQTDVSNLEDSKSNDKNNYYTFLNKYSTPGKLFNSLRYRYGSIDRFSWFIEDYVEQEKRFEGISKSFGFTPKVIEIPGVGKIILVTRVSDNSPAFDKGLKRGDLIIGLNGTKFEGDGWNSVINQYYDDTVEFMLGKKDGVTEKSRVALTKAEVSDNAIQLSKVFDDIAGRKVGYVVYNGFRGSYDKALNNVFGNLKAEGINELILDLRYNGGGSVLTCGYLASMIYGEGVANEDVFAKTIFNSKHPKRGFTLPFLSGIYQYDKNGNYIEGQDIPLNRLTGINKLYVITSKSTASASEMIINGLRPYIDVVTIGTKTYGKNVGSNTLYDNPLKDFRGKDGINTNHRNAMQPITFKIYNKLDQSDYTLGFEPTIEVDESKNWNNILPFGDENELMLKTALDKIRGVSARPMYSSENASSIEGAINEDHFEKEMYFKSEYIVNFIK